VALLASICAYNFYTKRLPVIGALNMGLCRTLSVFVGALAGPCGQYPLAVPAALPLGAYIAAVTNLARHETRATVPVLARLLPAVCVAVLGFWGASLSFNAPAKVPAAFPFLLSVVMAGWLAVRMFRRPAPPLPPMIGMHIRLLLPLQAAIAWLADPQGAGGYCAIGLFCLWPIARVVSRWFYAS
jgi:4-hydroxybenzoate polyprenyltransferase